ncbi:hypothetical protein XA68_18307 [Ophiocordyceps unilateralis]|uniref:Bromo domain-containing protein n=1 Tax=Ophiocordyceps unilateralis TaxID=268505 RepID=A0A2A9P379_OPHUN|nr:hypothetical protein XA68_18307 [Ophiocordyceps unilateralis]
MTSLGPKSPGPDAQPREPVPEKEQRSQINGHPASDEPELETKLKSAEGSSATKSPSKDETVLSPAESAVKKVDEPAEKPADKSGDEQDDKATEKPADKLTDQPVEKSADKSVDESAENPIDKPTLDEKCDLKDDPARADTTDADNHNDDAHQPEARSTSSTPTPKADDKKSPAHQSEANKAVEVKDSGSQPSDAKETVPKASEKSPDAAAQDVEMTDPPPEKDQTTAGPVAGEGTAAPSADASKGSEHDTVMTDLPFEEPVDASKPSIPDDTTPIAGDTSDSVAPEVELGSAGISQLAIGSAEKQSSPIPPPADSSMTDAPSTKMARERDEDAVEEPAPKRAKTEPTEDESPKASANAPTEPPTEAATEAPGLDEQFLTRLSNWGDSTTNAAIISPFQRREIRKLIARVKKTKSGSHFKDSVEKLWPVIWDSYQAKIDKPMDLGELERSLREGRDSTSIAIESFSDFRTNLALIFENALSFNGPEHLVTEAGANVVRTVWEDALLIPAEEPARPKALSKTKPVRESRAAATTIAAESAARRQSAGPAAVSPAADAPAAKPVPAAPPAPAAPAPVPAAAAAAAAAAQGPPGGDRRGSTMADADRPKRKVRAPKPKDIDYSTKPSRKKMKPELQFCDEVLTELMHSRNSRLNSWFMEPVDAEGLNIPTYYSTIKKPMDLGKVRRMLSGGEMTSLKDFDKNVRLIFDNCYKFNGPPSEKHPVSALAKELEDLYTEQMDKKDEWMSKHAAKANARAVSVSNASDEDTDDDDDDDGPEAFVDNKEIEELRAKLNEETQKLNELFFGGNESLIKIHKNIVDMLQNGLIDAVKRAKTAKLKRDRSKNSGKGGKAKAAGGRKSGGGPSQPKKSGGSKKAAAKKSLTAGEKDQVASAINDLEYPHLQRAIDIIKKDTGQNENTDGELELDIDQLSHDALFKLWDLCKKALPGFGP